MSSVAKSVYYFSFYLLIAGLSLFLFPNDTIGLLGFEATEEIWIHLVGALTFILGTFFFYMAKREVLPFFYISIFGRAIFVLAILLLVIFKNAPSALLLFAAVDLAGLLWTSLTFRGTQFKEFL
jgi:hypothetical protein